MPLSVAGQAPSLCVRREAYERSGLARFTIDAWFALTPEEFRVERDLVVIGPIRGVPLNDLFHELDRIGLRYYDDYFELSGNWPDWLLLFVSSV